MNVYDAERPEMAEVAMPEKRLKSIAVACLPLVLASAALFGMSATQAKADFRVCNATQNLIGVAIGYRVKTGWSTEGWWHVEPSNCKTLIEGPLSSRFYYLYAEDAERGGRWEGPINMCVADKEFKIAGINDCFTRGFQRAGFQEYDTGEQSSWMVQLTDDVAPGATGAPTADNNVAPVDAPAGATEEAPAEGAQAQPVQNGQPTQTP
jgi:uncharacterized membrane protein